MKPGLLARDAAWHRRRLTRSTYARKLAPSFGLYMRGDRSGMPPGDRRTESTVRSPHLPAFNCAEIACLIERAPTPSIRKLFCHVDDFCQGLVARENAGPFGLTRRRGPAPRMSLRDAVTILIRFRQSRYRAFKACCTRHVCEHMRSEFPMVSPHRWSTKWGKRGAFRRMRSALIGNGVVCRCFFTIVLPLHQLGELLYNTP